MTKKETTMNEKDYAREYGNRCRQIRQAKGLSQQDLADRMHTTPQNVSKWERDGIRDVNTVMQLSDVLGQDITSDQIDQEGVVGEIGKDILLQLINGRGNIEFENLVENMFGMSAERVSAEIFKLERIGMVVREQYDDFLDRERDGIFITAKGVITYKNINGLVALSGNLSNVVTYERILRGGERNIQEWIKGNVVARKLWKLPFAYGYKIDYILWLNKNYRVSFLMDAEKDDEWFSTYGNPYTDYLLTGRGCFEDILYRMALGLTTDTYFPSEVEADEFDTKWNEADDAEEKLYGMDYRVKNAQQNLSALFPWLVDIKAPISDVLSEDEKNGYRETISDFQMYIEEDETLEEMFYRNVNKEVAGNCLRWFSTDEIRKFVFENYRKASDETEKEVDRILEEVNTVFPESKEYFYRFPKEWEKNGLARQVREAYGLPERKVDED